MTPHCASLNKYRVRCSATRQSSIRPSALLFGEDEVKYIVARNITDVLATQADEARRTNNVHEIWHIFNRRAEDYMDAVLNDDPAYTATHGRGRASHFSIKPKVAPMPRHHREQHATTKTAQHYAAVTRAIIYYHKKLAARTCSTDHERHICFEHIKATGFLHVRGPAGRLCDTIHALRWTWPQHHVVRNQVGVYFDLRYIPHDALLHWQREAQRYILLRSVPDTQPSLQRLVVAACLIDISATTAMFRVKKTSPSQEPSRALVLADGEATQQCIASPSLGADTPPICRFGNEENEDMLHLSDRDVAWRPPICEDTDDCPLHYDDEGATFVALGGPALHGFCNKEDETCFSWLYAAYGGDKPVKNDGQACRHAPSRCRSSG